MITADIAILIPAYNEAQSIGKLIDDIARIGYRDIIVAASGCTDQTAAIAKLHGAIVVKASKGKGLAVSELLKQIKCHQLVMLDADLTYPAEYIPILVSMLRFNDAVVGVRQLNKANNPGFNRFGNDVLSHMAQILYGVKIHDVCSGMWAFNRNVLDKLHIQSQGFTLEAEIFTLIASNHFKLGQITVDYRARVGATKLNKVKDGAKIMAYLIERRLRL